MRETSYRASRVCRILSNPVIFAIVTEFLERDGGLTPSELGRGLRRSVQTVSTHLAKLRMADLVRYETDGRRTRYRLYPLQDEGPTEGRSNPENDAKLAPVAWGCYDLVGERGHTTIN